MQKIYQVITFKLNDGMTTDVNIIRTFTDYNSAKQYINTSRFSDPELEKKYKHDMVNFQDTGIVYQTVYHDSDDNNEDDISYCNIMCQTLHESSSKNVLYINAHARDAFNVSIDMDGVTTDFDGYLPKVLIETFKSSSDDLQLSVDIDTGKIIGWSEKEFREYFAKYSTENE